jgi:hypothetical protein
VAILFVGSERGAVTAYSEYAPEVSGMDAPLFPAMADGADDWTVIPPTSLAPVPEADEAPGQTGGTGGPHDETNRPLPRNATWTNNIPLTNAERTSLIQEYQLERHGDPRGLTAAGLGVFIKGKGVKLASKRGFLLSHFLRGTPFTMSSDGVMIIPPSE